VIDELQACPHPQWEPGQPCMCGQCPTPTGDEPDCALCTDDATRRPAAARIGSLDVCWVHWRTVNDEAALARVVAKEPNQPDQEAPDA
jgi:hypothetical protein